MTYGQDKLVPDGVVIIIGVVAGDEEPTSSPSCIKTWMRASSLSESSEGCRRDRRYRAGLQSAMASLRMPTTAALSSADKFRDDAGKNIGYDDSTPF